MIPCLRQRFLTRAVLVFGSVFGVFGAALTAQLHPGGVAAPFFRGAGAQEISDPLFLTNSRPLEIYTVYRPAGDAEEVVWSITHDDSTQRILTTHRIADLAAGRYLKLPPATACSAPILRSYTYRATAPASPPGEAFLLLGRAGNAPRLPVRSFSGDWLETVAYDRSLHPAERQRVESYLALRYGITLDQTEPTHYVLPGGIAWNALRAGNYAHRIFGVARDTAGGLDIRAAASNACGGGVIRLSAPATNDGTYSIIVSDDDGSLSYDRGRFGRRWRVETSGARPEVITLSFDPDRLHTLLPPGNAWELLLDTTGTGAFTEPLRIAATKSGYRLPTRWGEAHFTLAPARPYTPQAASAVFRQVSAVPNPAPQGVFLLRSVLAQPETLQLRIFDAAGKLVATRRSERALSHGIEQTLPGSGPYWLELRAGGETTTVKMIAQ